MIVKIRKGDGQLRLRDLHVGDLFVFLGSKDASRSPYMIVGDRVAMVACGFVSLGKDHAWGHGEFFEIKPDEEEKAPVGLLSDTELKATLK